MVAGSAVPSTLHEVASLRWKATSISLYVQWVFVSWYTSYNHINRTHSSEGKRRQGKKDQRPRSNSGPTLYRAYMSLLPSHSTQYQPRGAGLKRRWIAAHLWPVHRGDGGRGISTGLRGSRGWNSAIERRSQVRARSLVLFPLSPFPFWAVSSINMVITSIPTSSQILIARKYLNNVLTPVMP